MILPRVFAVTLSAAAGLLAMTVLVPEEGSSRSAEPITMAFLGVYFQNDNEMYEPTSDAERRRTEVVGRIFKSKLAETGRFRFAEISPELEARISAGQPPGECAVAKWRTARSSEPSRWPGSIFRRSLTSF